MARLAVLFLIASLTPGCAVYGGAGTAVITKDRIEAQGVGARSGVDADGPFARGGPRRVVIDRMD